MKKIIIMVVLISLLVPLYSISIESGSDILRKVDENSTLSGIDLSAQLTIISEDPTDGIEKSVVLQFRNDDDDKFLMLIKEPVAKKGQGYLMIDDNLWFYDPQSRKFSHTSMKEQFNDSDANNSDFQESSLIEEYEVTQVDEATLGSFDVYRIVLEATSNEVTYPKQILYVTQSTYLVLKSEDFSASDRLLRTSYYPSYTKAGDSFIPNKMIFIDNLVENKKTTITLSDISTKNVPDSLFTKAYVERVNN